MTDPCPEGRDDYVHQSIRIIIDKVTVFAIVFDVILSKMSSSIIS